MKILDTSDFIGEDTADADYDYFNEQWKDLMESLTYDNDKLFIRGSIGRWNGVNKGWLCTDYADKACEEIFKDCDDFRLDKDSDGLLTITGIHHDGRCTAEFWTINKKSEEKFDNDFYIDYENDVIRQDDEEVAEWDEFCHYLVPASFTIAA